MTEADRIQFSAKFEHPGFFGPVTEAAATRVRDVIICATDATVETDPDEYRQHPPIASAFLGRRGEAAPADLGRGVRIERLAHEESELVMNACSPRGHYSAPVRQFGQRYSLIRDVPLAEHDDHPFRWDPDGVLWDALTFSRLVRDNAYSTQYAARITDYGDGQQSVVYTLSAESQFAYRVRRDREWLDDEEGVELRDLLAAYWAAEGTLPPRVTRAMWRTEYASWIKWGDLIVPTLVGGLEALLKTERHRSTRQFTQRVPALAGDLEIAGVTEELCERLYDRRSEWVHGAHVRLFTTGQESQERKDAEESQGPETAAQLAAFEEVALLQDVLRCAARRCIEDERFREVFADDDAIRDRWPTSD